MKKILFLLLASAIIISCSRKEDVLSNIKFGNVSEKKFLEDMVANQSFLIHKENPLNKSDTTSIIYILEDESQNYFLRVNLNESFYTDRYKFGALRRMDLRIGEDIEEQGQKYRASGKISKKTIDSLYKYYCEIYGKPDTLELKYKYKLDFIAALLDKSPNKKLIDNRYIPGKKSIWVTKNFILSVIIPPVKKQQDISKIYYQEDNTDRISISYEMFDYKKEFKRIQDSIAKTLTPTDLIHIQFGKHYFEPLFNNVNDTKFNIELNSVDRLDRDEPKRIKGFRFNIIVNDSFKKELYRANDVTIELPQNSYLESRPQKGQYGQLMNTTINRLFWVAFNSHGDSKLATLKRYSDRNGIVIQTEIKSVLFEDGSILNSN